MQGCKKVNVCPVRLVEITDDDAGEHSPVGRKSLSLRIEWSSEAASRSKKVASYQVPPINIQHATGSPACPFSRPCVQITTDGGLENGTRTTVYSGANTYCEVHDLRPRGRKYLFCVTALTTKGVVEWCGLGP